jgi:DNA-binding transcriptional LysR family regulator
VLPKLLNITQSPLSIALRNLEEDVGGALFVRNQRSFQLTERGKILLRYAGSILHRVEACEQELRTGVAGAAGRLRFRFTAASSLLSQFPALVRASGSGTRIST